MAMKTLTRSFAGGEISPEMLGRIDLTQFQTGLLEAWNFIILPHGPARARKGSQYVNAAKVNDGKVSLIEFSFNNQQAYALEFGHLYIRFHTQRGTLAVAGTPVEVVSPYTQDDVMDIHYVQSADVLTLVHPNHPPKELRRTGPTTFTLTDISFVPTISPPAAITVAKTGTGTTYFSYVVTAISSLETMEESGASQEATSTNTAITAITKANPGVFSAAAHTLAVDDKVLIAGVAASMAQIPDGYYYVNTVPASGTFTLKNANGTPIDTTAFTTYTSGGTVKRVGIKNVLTTAGNTNTVTITPAAGAVLYYVYKLRNGLYGYIGETSSLTFIDDNITPDMTRTPPQTNNPFSGVGNYPGAVTYFEQRRCFAGSKNKPQAFWATRSGTESNMNFSIPTRDDDSIVLKLAARNVSLIEHMIPLSDLLLLTTDGDFRIYTQNSDVFSPNTVASRAQSYHGANNVQPITSGESAVYVRSQSSRVHEMAYDNIAYAFKANDISIMAPHLFDEYTITDMALTRSPFPIIWVVRSDGVLLGVTYMPSQKVWAWHQHHFSGEVESIAGVPEGNKDVLYLSIIREIDGVITRYIECLDLRQESVLEDAFHTECGLFYDGSPITNITGLDHLEGMTVNILADGETHPPQTVNAGAITLEYDASKICIGLPLTARLKTLPITAEVEAYAQGSTKNVNRVYLRTHQSGQVKVGQTDDTLVAFQDTTDEEYGSVAMLRSATLNIETLPLWDPDGQIIVENSDPTPLTVLSMVLEVALGD